MVADEKYSYRSFLTLPLAVTIKSKLTVLYNFTVTRFCTFVLVNKILMHVLQSKHQTVKLYLLLIHVVFLFCSFVFFLISFYILLVFNVYIECVVFILRKWINQSSDLMFTDIHHTPIRAVTSLCVHRNIVFNVFREGTLIYVNKSHILFHNDINIAHPWLWDYCSFFPLNLTLHVFHNYFYCSFLHLTMETRVKVFLVCLISVFIASGKKFVF